MLTHPNAIEQTWAPGMAQGAEITIACVGLSPFLEGEEGESLLTPNNGDRDRIDLPKSQVDFIKSLAIHGARIVLVVTGGSPISLGEVDDMVEAILFLWYPGMEGGKAVANVLFGDVSPGGKLPITFPKSLDQVPPFEDYSMDRRTYRYMTAEPLYPFGFGLSYSIFSYSNLVLDRSTISVGDDLSLTLKVANIGTQPAVEVVQFYIGDLEASTKVPVHKLVGFSRVVLEPGEERKIPFTLTPEMMSFFDEEGGLKLEPGTFRLEIGGCSPGLRGEELGAPIPVTTEFQVE
jgi:beta-glucosidase